jgi:hypothetical protein
VFVRRPLLVLRFWRVSAQYFFRLEDLKLHRVNAGSGRHINKSRRQVGRTVVVYTRLRDDQNAVSIHALSGVSPRICAKRIFTKRTGPALFRKAGFGAIWQFPKNCWHKRLPRIERKPEGERRPHKT